ncbi:translocation protein SEC62 [Cryptococcus neoformans Ze90-1]|nr:translocation protein SEC62 [Cryptococcus neoformans var. grubii Ze90-1]
MATPANATSVVDAQKRAPQEFKNAVDFLRAKAGPKVRLGILNGKRVEYFKGKTAIRTLLSPHYQKLKKVPPVKDEDEAKALMVKLLPLYVFFSLFPSFFLFPAYCETKSAFFLRTDRPVPETPIPSGQPKPLRLSPQQSFDPLAYYTWFYDGSPLYTYLGGLAMVLIMLAGVMFPLWPVKLRIGVWYLSVGVLGLIGAFLGLAVVRLVFWCVTVLTMKRAIWIFPNLFEDVGFVDSFIPGWDYDEPKKKKKSGTHAKGHTHTKKHKSGSGSASGKAKHGQGQGHGGVEVSSPAPSSALPTTAEGEARAEGGSEGVRKRVTVEDADEE